MAWCANRHLGGSVKSPSPARLKCVRRTPSTPPATSCVSTTVPKLRNARRISGDDQRILARDPVVVDLGPTLAQDEVLDPVGARPARRGVGPEPDAPGRDTAAAGHGGVLEVVPRLGPARLDDLGVVPEEALHRRLHEDAGELALHGPDVDEARCGLGQVGPGIDDVREVDEPSLPDQLEHVARSRQAGEIGRISDLEAALERSLEVASGAHHDAVAGPLLERLDGGPERVDLGAFPGPEDPDDRRGRARAGRTRACDQADNGGSEERCETAPLGHHLDHHPPSGVAR